LRITRQSHQAQADRFVFEVWSPFTGVYQPVDSIDIALRRITELTELISQMWLQRHPKQETLVDVPDADVSDGTKWAEFRVNATTYRSYDTRGFDRLGWVRAAGLAQAAKSTCARVGYASQTLGVIGSDAELATSILAAE
jgi:hypothetical protein